MLQEAEQLHGERQHEGGVLLGGDRTQHVLWRIDRGELRVDVAQRVPLADLVEMAPDGRFLGSIRPTGVRPTFTQKFDDLGIKLSPRVFGAAEPTGTRGWN